MSKQKESESFEDSVVTVIKGKHKGKTGYCDSHFSREAIVYFGSWADWLFCCSAVKLNVGRQSRRAKIQIRVYE